MQLGFFTFAHSLIIALEHSLNTPHFNLKQCSKYKHQLRFHKLHSHRISVVFGNVGLLHNLSITAAYVLMPIHWLKLQL